MRKLRWFTIIRLFFCVLLFTLIATSMWIDISISVLAQRLLCGRVSWSRTPEVQKSRRTRVVGDRAVHQSM